MYSVHHHFPIIQTLSSTVTDKVCDTKMMMNTVCRLFYFYFITGEKYIQVDSATSCTCRASNSLVDLCPLRCVVSK